MHFTPLRPFSSNWGKTHTAAVPFVILKAISILHKCYCCEPTVLLPVSQVPANVGGFHGRVLL